MSGGVRPLAYILLIGCISLRAFLWLVLFFIFLFILFICFSQREAVTVAAEVSEC